MQIIALKSEKKIIIKQSFLGFKLSQYVLESENGIFIFTKNDKELFRSKKGGEKPKLNANISFVHWFHAPRFRGYGYELSILYGDFKYDISFGHIVSFILPGSGSLGVPGTFLYSEIKQICDTIELEMPFSILEQKSISFSQLFLKIFAFLFIGIFILALWTLIQDDGLGNLDVINELRKIIYDDFFILVSKLILLVN